MINVQNVSVCKSNRNIIEGVNCCVKAGKITVIIGKNGAGKSTLLEALTGSNAYCQGQINWDGHALSQLSTKELATRRAVLSQSVSIDFPITVFDLVETGTYVCDRLLSKKEVRKYVVDALQEVELSDFINRQFNTLSGGEKKRIMLAKCLVQLNCCAWKGVEKYLFLDEPTAGLDIQQQHKLIELIKKLVQKCSLGVFAVLHDLDLAARFADEILWIKKGKIIAEGSPEETITPAVIRETLGVNAVVQVHPVFGCPHVITLPLDVNNNPLTPNRGDFLRV